MTGLIPPDEMSHEPESSPADPDAAPADEVAAVRELILRTHADAVPELIGGATIGELIASIGPARDAYARIVAQTAPAPVNAPAVPAGGTGPAPIDPARLSAPEKIRRGLASR